MGCRHLLALPLRKQSEVYFPVALGNRQHIDHKIYPKFDITTGSLLHVLLIQKCTRVYLDQNNQCHWTIMTCANLTKFAEYLLAM